MIFRIIFSCLFVAILLFFRFSLKAAMILTCGAVVSILAASFLTDLVLSNVAYYGGLMVTFYFFIMEDVNS